VTLKQDAGTSETDLNMRTASANGKVGKPKSAEMHSGPGFRIRTQIERCPHHVIDGLARYDTPAVSDLLNRLYSMAPEVRNLTDPDLRLIGPACTVKCYPGDNLMVHKALDIAQPGDVVVIDTSSSSLNAVAGDLISTKARHRGIAGFVVDGLVRDLQSIRALGDFPVFARGVTPIGPLHRGPGEINHPISAGGIVVYPGDVVTADVNGVVVVPRDAAEEVLGRLERRARVESDYTAAVARGDFSNAWVDETLRENGVEVDDAAPRLAPQQLHA
jgi:regulator of RNase E activity RraA